MSWLLSLCPLRCNLCHSLSCSVSRKQGPLPLPPSFQLLPGKGRGICSSCSSRSGYGSLMAVFLKSGHGSLHGCFSCCIPVTLHPPSTLCLGVERLPTAGSPWIAHRAICLPPVYSSECSPFIEVFQLNQLSGLEASCQARGIHLWQRFFL